MGAELTTRISTNRLRLVPGQNCFDCHQKPLNRKDFAPPRVGAANVLNCLNFFPGENAQISFFSYTNSVQGSCVSNLRSIGEVAAELLRLKVARQKRGRLAESAVHILLTLPLPRARFYQQSTLLHRSPTSAPQLASPTRHATARTIGRADELVGK